MIQKKAEISAVTKLVIAVIAFLAIMTAFNLIIQKTLSESQEGPACRSSNILAAKSRLDTGSHLGTQFQASIVPQACKTYSGKVLTGTEEQVKLQIADLMTLCWWKFANGNYKNLLCGETKTLGAKWSCNEPSCFECYTFQIGSPVSFTAANLRSYMSEPTSVKYYKDPKTGNQVSNPNQKLPDGSYPVPVSYSQYIEYDEEGSPRGIIIFNKLNRNMEDNADAFVFKQAKIYSINYFEPHDGTIGWFDKETAKLKQSGIYVDYAENAVEGKGDICKQTPLGQGK